MTTNGGLTWSDTGNIRNGSETVSNATECADTNKCAYRTKDYYVTFYCEGNVTTTAQAIYNDYRTRKAELSADYQPQIRLVASSPQGSSWYKVTLTSRTVESVNYSTYRIDIPNNQDTGTIICYWEIYNRANNEILYTTSSWTITRNKS